jgi:hypothetical protein
VTPIAAPVTTPVPETVATVVLELVHVPPGVASLKETVEPIHALEGPVIGVRPDVTFNVAVLVQPPPSEYVRTHVPTAAAVTIPVSEPTVATEGALLVHTPPGVELDNVMVEPRQTGASPEMVPTEVLTVTCLLMKSL